MVPPLETRQNLLAVLFLVRLCLALLPRLLECRELTHCRHGVAAPLKLVLGRARALENGRVDRLEHEVVLGARKVEETQAVDVLLVFGRRGYLTCVSHMSPGSVGGRETYPVHCRLDVPSRQEAERVARVDRQAPVERLGPLPLPRLVVPDLQGRDGLSEEEGDGAEVGVAEGPEAVAQLLQLLRGELGVLHVPQVGLVVDVPAVNLCEEVWWQLEGEGDEVQQRVEDLVVQLLREGLDECLFLLEQLRQGLGDVSVLGCNVCQNI